MFIVLINVKGEVSDSRYGVSLHVWEEYPDTKSVLLDLSSSGSYWVRSDWFNLPGDMQFWNDMKAVGVKMLALLPQDAATDLTDSDWYSKTHAYITEAVNDAPDMPAWEVGGEPELYGMQPSQYMQLLQMAYTIIKSVAPNAIIG